MNPVAVTKVDAAGAARDGDENMSARQKGPRGRRVAAMAALGVLYAFGCCTGYIVHQYDLLRFPARFGLGRPSRRGSSPVRRASREREAIRRLEAIGYLGGYEPAPPESGITTYDSENAQAGLNLYVSGDASKAFLMTMEGEIVHQWSCDFRRIWPNYKPPPGVAGLRKQAWPEGWRRVYMFGNGDLLAIYEGIGMIKLDKDSRLLWAYPGRCHHDLFVAEDGTIYVLTRTARIIERIHATLPILEDFITLLEPDGTVRKHISILRCFENSRYAPILKRIPPSGDIFHTNTLEVLDGRLAPRSAAFAAGNVLISLRQLSLIATVDIKSQEVVFALSGSWARQHHPTVVSEASILLFDNLGRPERSTVIEFDPFSQQVIWTYGLAPSETLFSKLSGACQRLPNGNTLITETDAGRAIEVTPSNEIVWEFLNPARTGRDGELIATLSEVVRIHDPAQLDWLKPAEDQ